MIDGAPAPPPGRGAAFFGGAGLQTRGDAERRRRLRALFRYSASSAR